MWVDIHWLSEMGHLQFHTAPNWQCQSDNKDSTYGQLRSQCLLLRVGCIGIHGVWIPMSPKNDGVRSMNLAFSREFTRCVQIHKGFDWFLTASTAQGAWAGKRSAKRTILADAAPGGNHRRLAWGCGWIPTFPLAVSACLLSTKSHDLFCNSVVGNQRSIEIHGHKPATYLPQIFVAFPANMVSRKLWFLFLSLTTTTMNHQTDRLVGRTICRLFRWLSLSLGFW